MVERAFLSAPVADMVEREPVEAFMKSELYKRMRRSAESYREQRLSNLRKRRKKERSLRTKSFLCRV